MLPLMVLTNKLFDFRLSSIQLLQGNSTMRFHRRIEWHSEAGSKLCYRSTNVWGDDRWRKPQVSTTIRIIITLFAIKNHESQLLPLLGPFHKYSAAQIVQGGKKFQARNETAESFFQCAAKCNAAVLVNAKWVNLTDCLLHSSTNI